MEQLAGELRQALGLAAHDARVEQLVDPADDRLRDDVGMGESCSSNCLRPSCMKAAKRCIVASRRASPRGPAPSTSTTASRANCGSLASAVSSASSPSATPSLQLGAALKATLTRTWQTSAIAS